MAKSTYKLEQENLQLAAEIAALRLMVKALIEIDGRRRPGLKAALAQICQSELTRRQASAEPADREAMAAFHTAMGSLLKPIEIDESALPKEGPLRKMFNRGG